MAMFENQENRLACRFNGEVILICPWGKNALRVLSGMMTAPVLTDWALLPQPEGATEREVYLPGGAEWTALHSGKKYAGGSAIIADAPLDIIPVFLKNGKPDCLRAS